MQKSPTATPKMDSTPMKIISLASRLYQATMHSLRQFLEMVAEGNIKEKFYRKQKMKW